MIKSYRTEYPNHAHQLSVSVSKHYYLTKSGILKYQKKKQEINLDNINNSERIHIVHYVMRDHFSGLFYSEFVLSNKLIPIQEFLFRAWAEEKDYSFFGLPEMLTVPETVEKKFPTLKERIAMLGITVIKVSSGFQGGIRDIKTIEEYMKIWNGRPIERAKTEIKDLFQDLNSQKSRNGKDTKFALWRNNIASITVPTVEWLDAFNSGK